MRNKITEKCHEWKALGLPIRKFDILAFDKSRLNTFSEVMCLISGGSEFQQTTDQ